MRRGSELKLRHGLYHLENVSNPAKITGLFDNTTYLDQDRAEKALLVLRNAFDLILTRQYSHLNFEELYRNGYYLVMHKYGGPLYSGVQSVITDHITLKVLPRVLANVKKSLLHTMNCSWNNHHSSMLIISDALMYLDRMYISQTGLDDVYTLGLDIFKNLIVYHMEIQPHLQNTLLRLVMLERCGELIDRSSFRCVTKMLMVLGINSPELYRDTFEGPFLIQSEDFFREESRELLKEQNASLYLKRVQQLIAQETDRSEQCFDETTTPKLLQVAEFELIKMHMETIFEMRNSGVVFMMENQMTEDLACMYSLLSRVSDGLEALFNCTSRYIREKGRGLNQHEGANSNAAVYIQSLLDLKESFDFYLMNSFSNDKSFKKIIASDFEYIINQNPKSPESLSLFIDDKLRKSARGLSEEDKTVLLENIIVLFRFLQDKDLFQQYYKQHLAKRLLTGKGLNEESESDVIAKFKDECGYHYIRKMDGMFRDMSGSCRITEDFRKYLSETGDSIQGVDMSLRVLTANYWPTQSVPSPCNMPSAPSIAFETFRKFYLQKHCGRQLTLLPQLSSAELETYVVQSLCQDGEGWHSAQTQPCGETRSYTLQVSTYQMSVLMLFNDRPHWNFQELQSETAISEKDLQKALQPLVMGRPSQKVLIKHPDSRNIDFNDLFFVNTAFTSKCNKVKIPPTPAKYEMDFERQDTVKRVNNNRYEEVEAAIVRIMKNNKVMNHESLVCEVIESLRGRFVPPKDFVKTRIEVLIEREYIARHPNDRKLYEYVPA